MDKVTVFGTVFGFLTMFASIYFSDQIGNFFVFVYIKRLLGPLGAFFDVPSVIVVFGGAFAGTCIAYSYDRIRSCFQAMKACFIAPPQIDYLKLISTILSTSEIARKEGILALDSRLAEVEDPFLQRGLQMVVDGVDVKIIEEVMVVETESRNSRHADVKSSLDLIASIAPAFGLIGTIMGLVGLLRNLNDPTTIGPNMALALVTTFYGAVAANMFLIPFGKKLDERSHDESLYGEIIVRGCLLIAAGTHPRIIQERLLAPLPDKARKDFNELHLAEELKKSGEGS